MLVLNSEDVRQALPMPVAIDAMKRAFAALTQGAVELPPRTHLDIKPAGGTTLVMPVYVNHDGEQVLAVKVVSLFPRNPQQGIAFIQATVMVFDPQTGQPVAVLDGAALTAIRTGAATGAATDYLARRDSSTVAIIGAGVQARYQLQAVCTVRDIKTVWVYDPARTNVDALIADMAGTDRIPRDLRPAASSEEAIAGADIICTATTSKTPVFNDADLKPGVHINAIGSYQPDVCEIPPQTVARATVVVDSCEAARHEAGDLIQSVSSGLFDWSRVHAELGELVLERKAGRTSDDEVTLFKSVGVAVQDAFAASAALKNAT